MAKTTTFLLVIMLAAAINGCVIKRSSSKSFICPKIEQNCKPNVWNGIPLDTSVAFRSVSDSFYVFEQVKQINSPEDEWAFSFIDRKHAILTFNNENQQRVMMVRLVKDNKAVVESGIGIPLEGSIGAFSLRDKKAYFAYSNPYDDPNNWIGNSDVYTSDLQGNILVNLRNLGDSINYNKGTWESQPAISPDGNVLFFSSDMHNIDGTDIWFSVKLPNGEWSSPINCGDSINTNCDELTPFVTHDSKKLLFSSAGHETVGGYDIFESTISPSFWLAAKQGDLKTLKTFNFFGSPKNMRPPLNTPADELFPSSPGDINTLLYYSSNQASTGESILLRKGGFDIYVRYKTYSPQYAEQRKSDKKEDLSINVELKETSTLKEPEFVSPTYKVQGKVFNAETKQPIADADITVKEIKPELEQESEFELTSQNKDIFFDAFKIKSDETGKYEVNLQKDKDFEITAQAKDLFFDSFKIRIDKDDTTTLIKKDFYIPAELTLRINFPTDVYNAPYKYALDSNGVETNDTWRDAINLLAKNLLHSTEKIKKLILIGHTDDVGSESYNLRLGQNRVNFIVNELVKRGVPRDMLEARSAGELEPLPKREEETMQMWRKRCRRVELQKVLND